MMNCSVGYKVVVRMLDNKIRANRQQAGRADWTGDASWEIGSEAAVNNVLKEKLSRNQSYRTRRDATPVITSRNSGFEEVKCIPGCLHEAACFLELVCLAIYRCDETAEDRSTAGQTVRRCQHTGHHMRPSYAPYLLFCSSLLVVWLRAAVSSVSITAHDNLKQTSLP